MPNPINLLALNGTTAHFSVNAGRLQRIRLVHSATGQVHWLQLPAAPLTLRNGSWAVTGYYLDLDGQWKLSRGRSTNDQIAEFDDGTAAQGDNDFNDAVVSFVHDN